MRDERRAASGDREDGGGGTARDREPHVLAPAATAAAGVPTKPEIAEGDIYGASEDAGHSAHDDRRDAKAVSSAVRPAVDRTWCGATQARAAWGDVDRHWARLGVDPQRDR